MFVGIIEVTGSSTWKPCKRDIGESAQSLPYWGNISQISQLPLKHPSNWASLHGQKFNTYTALLHINSLKAILRHPASATGTNLVHGRKINEEGRLHSLHH